MKIPTKVIEDFLEPYKRSARYLKQAAEDDNYMTGRFTIPQSAYVREGISSGHLNMADVVMCYNQLAFAGLANKIARNSIPDLEDFTYETFKDNQLNGLIYALDEVKFRVPIDPQDFSGTIEIGPIRKRNDTYFIKTAYDFEGKTTGEVSLAMRMRERR